MVVGSSWEFARSVVGVVVVGSSIGYVFWITLSESWLYSPRGRRRGSSLDKRSGGCVKDSVPATLKSFWHLCGLGIRT